MPMHIDATFRTAQDISLDAFRAPEGAAAEFRDLTIEVNGRAFRVSFANPNAPDVSFASHSLFNTIFNRSSRTAVKARLDELVTALSERRAFARDVGSVVSVTGFRDNLRQTLRLERDEIAQAAGGKVAVYGFSGVRDPARPVVDRASEKVVNGQSVQVLTPQVINDYNRAIGLPGTDESAALTIAFMRDNDRHRWDYGRGQDDGNVSAADKDEWTAYLRGKDVDLFSKIRRACAEAAAGKRTGWAGEVARQGLMPTIHDLVRKNVDPRLVQENPDVNLVLGAVADCVAEIVETNFGELDVAGIDAKLDEIVARHAPVGKETFVKRVLDNVSMAAFWRQTSKHGLDFFKARGQAVVFDWTTFDGLRSDGTELGDKWWKRGDADVADHFGAAITNSEMRHLTSPKYAAKPGVGRLLRIEGSLTPEAAERAVAARLDDFDALDAQTLGHIVDDLEAGFALVDAAMFREAAVDLIKVLPWEAKISYLDSDGTVSSPAQLLALCESALQRVRERVAATTSPAVKAALIANVAAVFQAEVLKDPSIVEKIEEARVNRENEYRRGAASPLALRQLAGIDRGFGSKVFFSPRTGQPNELGQALLDAGDDVLESVRDFRLTVAAALGLPEENLFGSPAFKAFVMRAVRETGGDLKKIVAKLGTIRVAADAKAAVDAHLRTRIPLTPEAKKVFDRRGDWDLNRLVYNEAVDAMAHGRPVDVERLKRNADVICELCSQTVEFVADFAGRLNPDGVPDLRLSDDEVARLTDAYFDREGSAINSYRLTGREEYVARFADETASALLKAATLILGIQAYVHSCRTVAHELRESAASIREHFHLDDGLPLSERARATLERVDRIVERADALDALADQLTPARLKDIAINAVATRGKLVHGRTALAILRDLAAAGPIPTGVGTTNADHLANFARTFADDIKEAWADTLLEAAQEDEIGYDDGNTALKMAFATYLRENPAVKQFLDRESDESLLPEVMEHFDFENPEPGDPIRNVLDNVMAHGRL